MKWGFHCAVLFLGSFCAAVTASAADSDRSKLIALENAWNQAQLQHDAKALDNLVADSFVYTDYDGKVMNKNEFMADIKDPAYKATVVANENEQVYSYPNFAVVVGTYHTKGTYKGKPFDHYGRFTDTWMSRDGHWQCVASHTTLLNHKD